MLARQGQQRDPTTEIIVFAVVCRLWGHLGGPLLSAVSEDASALTWRGRREGGHVVSEVERSVNESAR